MIIEISTKQDDDARHAELLALLGGTAPPDAPPPSAPAGKVLVFEDQKVALNKTQLWWKKSGQYCWSCFHELRFDIELTEPSTVKVFGAVNLKHRETFNGPIGFGVKATVRTAASFAAMPTIPTSSVDLAYWQSVETTGIIPGSKRAGNIASIADHYGCADIAYKINLPAGFHRIEHWGNSHTTGQPEDSSYAELNQNAVPDAADPYTMLFLEVYR